MYQKQKSAKKNWNTLFWVSYFSRIFEFLLRKKNSFKQNQIKENDETYCNQF